MHACACGASINRESKRCKACDREWRSKQMSEKPIRLRHGYAKTGAVKPEFAIWANMIQRCTDPKASQFASYGGRGISVCKRWLSFENFLADMGPRPEGKHASGRALYTLDRIDNDGDYEPGNCEWATYKKQARHTTRSRKIEYRGVTKTLVEWVEQLGLSYKIVHQRIARGWSIERAFEAG